MELPRGHRATAVGGEGPRTYDPYGKLCDCWSIQNRGVWLRNGCGAPLGGGILAFQAGEETVRSSSSRRGVGSRSVGADVDQHAVWIGKLLLAQAAGGE